MLFAIPHSWICLMLTGTDVHMANTKRNERNVRTHCPMKKTYMARRSPRLVQMVLEQSEDENEK